MPRPWPGPQGQGCWCPSLPLLSLPAEPCVSSWGILSGSVRRCSGPGLEGQLVWPEGHHWFLPHSSETLFMHPLQLGASFSGPPTEAWSNGVGWASCCGNLTPFSEGPRLPKRQSLDINSSPTPQFFQTHSTPLPPHSCLFTSSRTLLLPHSLYQAELLGYLGLRPALWCNQCPGIIATCPAGVWGLSRPQKWGADTGQPGPEEVRPGQSSPLPRFVSHHAWDLQGFPRNAMLSWVQ